LFSSQRIKSCSTMKPDSSLLYKKMLCYFVIKRVIRPYHFIISKNWEISQATCQIHYLEAEGTLSVMQWYKIFPSQFECLSLTTLAIFSSICFSARDNRFIRSSLSMIFVIIGSSINIRLSLKFSAKTR
jgi:hypothetical protein